MNSIYIGDRPLDPPEDDECETCGRHADSENPFTTQPCPDCQYDSDPGEPNEEPDL